MGDAACTHCTPKYRQRRYRMNVFFFVTRHPRSSIAKTIRNRLFSVQTASATGSPLDIESSGSDSDHAEYRLIISECEVQSEFISVASLANRDLDDPLRQSFYAITPPGKEC